MDNRILDKIKEVAKHAIVGRWRCDGDDEVYRYVYTAKDSENYTAYPEPVCDCSPGKTAAYIAEVFPARIWQLINEYKELRKIMTTLRELSFDMSSNPHLWKSTRDILQNQLQSALYILTTIIDNDQAKLKNIKILPAGTKPQ